MRAEGNLAGPSPAEEDQGAAERGQERRLGPQHFSPGLSVAQIEALERRFDVRLPDDLRLFYTNTDGTQDATDPEHGWTTFWSVNRWESVGKANRDESKHLVHALVIADYSLSSWWYAQELSPGDRYGTIYLVGTRDGQPTRIAGSFSAFLRMVLDDDAGIYPDD